MIELLGLILAEIGDEGLGSIGTGLAMGLGALGPGLGIGILVGKAT